MSDDLRRKNRVVGVKQTRRALEEGRVVCLHVARDADARIIDPLRQLCEQEGIPVELHDTMKQLGKAAGIDVGASVVGVLRE
jgi:large subunit ribosomal protein L7A